MTARATIALALLAMTAVLAAGCGSDDDSATTAANGGGDGGGGNAAAATEVTTSSLSKDEFLEQAEKVCNEERKNVVPRFSAYLKQHKGEKAEDEVFADMIRAVLLTTIEKEIDAVRALGAPEGDEAEIESILNGQEEAVAATAKLKSVKDSDEYEKYFVKSNKQAEAYGLPACTH